MNMLTTFTTWKNLYLCCALMPISALGFAQTSATPMPAISAMPAMPAIPIIEASHLITMDANYLAYAKQKLGQGDSVLQVALDKLLQDANVALKRRPDSVVNKNLLPASGNKNDYLSFAPYWWPDPRKPDGLPYINKDGQVNPSAKNNDTDSNRLDRMCQDLQILSLAYYFTGDVQYADKATEVIRTWFLQAATRMNPHLRYAQAIKGITDGRGIGLIDSRNFPMVIDAALLLAQNKRLPENDLAALKAWFKDYLDWMINSENGIDEYNQFNNHGMFYEMQIANYALFTDNTTLAKRSVQRAMDLRITSQIAADGKQYAELERTKPFHYSVFNLEAMMNLARYGEHLGIDVWKSRKKTRSIFNAMHYLGQFVAAPEKWPWKELNGKPEVKSALPLLLKAERAYGKGSFSAYIEAYKNTAPKKDANDSVPDYLIWALQ